jgi:hypothetical protein
MRVARTPLMCRGAATRPTGSLLRPRLKPLGRCLLFPITLAQNYLSPVVVVVYHLPDKKIGRNVLHVEIQENGSLSRRHLPNAGSLPDRQSSCSQPRELAVAGKRQRKVLLNLRNLATFPSEAT